MKKGIIVGLAVAAAILIAAVQPASALYQWVDDKGILHITDYPPPSKAAPEPVEEAAKPAPAPAAAVPPVAAPTVTVPTAAPAIPLSKPAATAVTAPVTKPAGTSPAAAPGVLTLPAISPQTAPAATALPAAPAPVLPAPPFPQSQEVPPGLVAALAGGFLMVALAVVLVFYIYFALCMHKIGTKLNVEGAWAAWIPVVNSFWPLIGAAGKPIWWAILFFIPVVNFFVIMYLWSQVIGNLGRNQWLTLLLLVPIVNIVFIGVLAFSGKD
jgi:hypothetical protein